MRCRGDPQQLWGCWANRCWFPQSPLSSLLSWRPWGVRVSFPPGSECHYFLFWSSPGFTWDVIKVFILFCFVCVYGVGMASGLYTWNRAVPSGTVQFNFWPDSLGIRLFLLELCWYLAFRLFKNFSFALEENLLEIGSRSSLVALWLKGPALSLLWSRFDPWPGNFCMQWVWPKKKKWDWLTESSLKQRLPLWGNFELPNITLLKLY